MTVSSLRLLALLTAFSCFLLPFSSVRAQTPASSPRSDDSIDLAAETAKAKAKIEKVGIGKKPTIVRRDGKSFHGSVAAINAESVVVSEIDLRTNIEIDYQQIKRVEKGYSPPNRITGQRPLPKTHKAISFALLAVLGALVAIIIAGLSDKDF